ncbi:hypothetical protein ACK33C_22325 [Aeromonas hydrophila]|uniref:hypothetical protein n=1 Tax=Aeromonas hydrophila TaxID=644 RepID=UPI0039874E02
MTMYVDTKVAQRLDMLLTELIGYMSPEVCDGQVMSMVLEAKELTGEMISPHKGGLLLPVHAAHYRHGYPVTNAKGDQSLS